MNKSLLLFLVLASFVSSCRKDDKSLFNQSPDDRLNATIAKYQAQLSGAPYGWKAIIYPAGGGAYGFYFKFTDSNRVRMYSDFDTATAVNLKESSYRLKAIQQPSLIFDTYSYVHLLADPNEYIGVVADVNSGPSGIGLKSDFEFYFDSSTADSITLVGRYNGSKAVLTRATAQELTAYTSGLLGAGFFINRIQTYFKRVTIGAQSLDVKISPADHSITLSYLGANGALVTFTTGYYLSAGGINFVNPLVIGNLTITGFNNMQWVATTQSITMTVNNTASTITSIVVPLKVDVAAPKRWRDYAVATSSIGYWYSVNGFHVNGVDDAYNVNSLTSGTSTYYYLMYIPGYGSNYDFLGPAFLNAAQTAVSEVYGTAVRLPPTFTADGRAIFTRLGEIPPYPTSGPAVNTRTKFYEVGGFYFVQTGSETYDMVSATDGRSWITWETF